MTRSSFVLDESTQPQLSKGYIGGIKCEQYPVRELPAGALYSTLGDMGRFIKMILNGGTSKGKTLLKSTTVKQMITRQSSGVKMDLDISVGLSWQLTNRLGPSFKKQRMAWHDGSFELMDLLWGFLPAQRDPGNEYRLEFVKVDGQMILATLDKGTKIPFGYRISPSKISGLWKKSLGKYKNRKSNGDFVYVKSVRLRKKKGFLMGEVSIGGDHTSDMSYSFVIEPISDKEGYVMGIGRYRGDVLTLSTERGRMSLRFSGYRLKKK